MRHESEIQYVVRRVLAEALRSSAPKFAERLDGREPEVLEPLLGTIEEMRKAWSEEFRVFALPTDGVYWRLSPELVETEEDGPLVRLRWGWHDDERAPSVTTSGEDAFDLAIQILEFFTAEDGELRRPERPEIGPGPPELQRFLDDFHGAAAELMEKDGFEGSASLADVRAWIASGKPDEPLRHEWVEYPEDHVVVCSICGHYYRTDCDDWGNRVCSGKPLMDDMFQSIHHFDPRRSPELREAQRLDRLTSVMAKVDATAQELEPLLVRSQEVVAKLGPEDRARYDRERVGLGDG